MFYERVDSAIKSDADISLGRPFEKQEVAFASVISGTEQLDPEPFEDDVIFLFIDNSVTNLDIAKGGHIYHEGFETLTP